jgi:phenylalanyl-tRNA synthetase beta chain
LIGLPVDAANYICLDVGVPLHIFDMDKLPRSLTIRDAHAGEKLRTLDGKETTLRDGVVVISSEDEPLSIAGIMGGESSAYSKSTSRILVEGAYFDKVAIAKAGQALRILSDARIRCERGVDPEMIDHAVRYVAHIIAGVCDCKISSVKKQGALPANKFTIDLTFGKFAALTGLDREDFAASASILKTLGITVLSVSDDCIGVETPSWRHDLTIEEDLIEEILRISGFENIKESELESVDSAYHTSVTDKITDALAYSGYDEIKTFPFTDRATASLFADPEKLLALKDSVSDDGSILRPSIAISHLKAVKNAQSKSQKNSKIFEVGRQFSRTGDKVVEDHIAIATISEKLTDRNWRANQTDVSVFDIKEVLEKVLNIAVNEWRLRDDAPDYYHPGRRGSYVFQKDTVIAYFGEIHPAILHELDIAGPVVCFELFLNRLPQTIEYKAKPQLMLSQYQQVTRDFSFIVRQSVRASDIVNTIRRTKINEIVDIGIFDVYESADIGDGKKAVAVEVTMQSDRDTLSADQIANISERIIDAVSKSCGGQLRDK